MDEEYFQSMKKLVEDNVALITIDSDAYKEALDRSTRFLTVMAIVSDYKLDLRRQKAKLETLQDAFYAKALQEADSKNVTEKKALAGMNGDYTQQKEKVDEIEAAISWCNTYIDIFKDAHVTFRQLSKGE